MPWVEVYIVYEKWSGLRFLQKYLHFSWDLLIIYRGVPFACPGSIPIPVVRARVLQSYPFLTDDSPGGRARNKVPGLRPTQRPGVPSCTSRTHFSAGQISQQVPQVLMASWEQIPSVSGIKTLFILPAPTPVAPCAKSSSRLVLPHSFPVCSPFLRVSQGWTLWLAALDFRLMHRCFSPSLTNTCYANLRLAWFSLKTRTLLVCSDHSVNS